LRDRYDVVVVGAGIMGISSAYHLQKNNPSKKVLLVDRYGAAGQGNTGRSNAMFRNTFTSADNQILADSSIDFYLHVQRELKVDIGLQEIGYLWLMDEAQISRSERFLRRMEDNGIETASFGKEYLRRLLPSMTTDFESDADAEVMSLQPVDGGVFGPKCGRLDPDRLVRFYEDRFVKAGGEVSFGTDAKKLVLAPSKPLGIEGEPLVWQDARVAGISVRGTAEVDVLADTVVLAGGAWTNEMLEPIGIDGHVKAKKRQLFSVYAEGPALEKLLRTTGFNPQGLLPLVILPKAGVHFKPVSEEMCFWVACEDEANRPFINLPEHDLGRYGAERQYYERGVYPVLKSYFPDFKDAKLRAMWAGLYAYNTIDNLPFAFKSGNLIVVGGDSGSGIMKGDALGRVVNALYRDEGDASLYGGRNYKASKLGFERRDVEREEWVI
jgi:glycine/D-amino acid oxidase-like deaminating enzyme